MSRRTNKILCAAGITLVALAVAEGNDDELRETLTTIIANNPAAAK